MTHETQQTIGAWQVATFGPLPSPTVGFARAQDEMDELADAVIAGDREAMGREMADVVIVLSGMAEQLGIDLQAEIDRKMAINRSRVWATNGDGTGRHVKDEALPLIAHLQIKTCEAIPTDQAVLVQDGKEVGRIVNIGEGGA